MAIGFYGSNVCIGVDNRVIKLMEVSLKRPLQWLICMLHINELPFHDLVRHMDKGNSGPSSHSGTIGKILKARVKVSLFEFIPIKENESQAYISN